MKKINTKGIGHHLLLILVAVVAVIGGAGYFVWQRQQDNDIDAKAAGYTYQVVTSANMGSIEGSSARFLACSQLASGKNYTLNVMVESMINKPIDAYVKVKNKNVLSLKLNTSGAVLGTKNINGGTSLVFGDVGGLFTPKTYTVKDMLPCNHAEITRDYKYQAVLSTTNIASDPNPQNAMFACTLTNADGTYTLETKLTGTSENSLNGIANDFNASQNLVTIFRPYTDVTTVYGWSRPVVKKGTAIGFYGNYVPHTTLQETKLYGLGYPPLVENIQSCK